ncbi:MAG: small multi-drug export protein [Clostridia bacterium]|nr:small multi-drug export protein [Clostridia bacterium]
MIEAIESFFININPSFGTFMTSMFPIIELRGAIPLGIGLGLDWFWVYVISIIGNMIPIPFVILIIRPLIDWLVHSRLFGKIGQWLDQRTKEKSQQVTKYKKLGLLIFVAIPLPGTGAWSGAMVAGILNMRLKDALPVIFGGVSIAGAAMVIISKFFQFLL